MAATGRGGGVADLGGEMLLTYAKDGISYTFSIVPAALGKAPSAQENNPGGAAGRLLPSRGDGGGDSISTSILNREKLLDAIEHRRSIRI